MMNFNKMYVRMLSMMLAFVMICAMVGCDVPAADSTTAPTEATIQEETTEVTTEATTEAETAESTEATEEVTEEPTEETTEASEPHGEEQEQPSEEPTEEAAEPSKETAGGNASHIHQYADTAVEPTCTKKGYVQHECSCGDSYKDTYVEASGHDYKDEVVAPTTSAKGYTLHTCNVCGYSYKDTYTDKLEGEEATEPSETVHTHNYTSKVTEPTCTVEGYTTYACSCGDSYKDNRVGATGHHWGDWVVTKEATTSAEGEQTRACTACGATDFQTIPMVVVETIDTAALEAYGRSYAASLGFTIDYSLGKGNSGYYPGLDYYITTTEGGYSCVASHVSSTYNMLMAAWGGDLYGARANVLVEYRGMVDGYHKIVVWCFYG